MSWNRVAISPSTAPATAGSVSSALAIGSSARVVDQRGEAGGAAASGVAGQRFGQHAVGDDGAEREPAASELGAQERRFVGGCGLERRHHDERGARVGEQRFDLTRP